jgi:phage terminase small subunit
MEMAKELTLKEKKFVKNYAATGNKAKAVIDAGYNLGSQGGKPENRISVASQIGATRLKKVEVQESLEKILTNEGITKEAMVGVMRDLLFSEDKRVQLGVLDMLHKIEGNYKAQENKIIGLFEGLKDLQTNPEQQIEHNRIESEKLQQIE